ncbi:MAG TPA: hypothetical protein PLO37_21280 [Candidatus Hydrogenedentes bacterium]|nr:hypothetical protein [Candidatus Hydrogenedentota bacterium]HPG69386.1 hypothetical protein [Candidatus Hydrogenedentota bacterium]
MRVVFDENVSPRFADLLQLCFKDLRATHVNQEGLRGKRDVDVLRTLAEYRPLPVLVGADGNITRRGDERKALKDSQVSYVLFESGFFNMQFPEQAWRLVKLWPVIRQRMEDAEPPTRILVNLASGKIGPL